MYQYLLFDLDGTLTDSAEGIIKCVQYAAKKMGAAHKNADELKVFVGPPLRKVFRRYMGFLRKRRNRRLCITESDLNLSVCLKMQCMQEFPKC